MNRWTELTEALSQLPTFENVNSIKRQLDGIRPLSQEVEGRVMQKLRLEWNYHSNAIEGNKLTYGETYSFLMYGLTAKGKPFKDHLDIKGHNEAIDFLVSIVKDDRDLTEGDIRDLHKMILVEPYKSATQTSEKTIRIGEYKQYPNHVITITGETHYYATPEEVPILMHELVSFYNEARKNPNIHPSVLAAFVHHRFVNIHPFDDGNGRLARILMNLILMKNGYPPAIIKLKERTDYYAALNQADKNEYQSITELIAETVLESMNLYLKAARGESIEDVSDLDKEIALFKGSFEKTYVALSKEVMESTIINVFFPICKIASVKFIQFDDLFEGKEHRLTCYSKHFNVEDYFFSEKNKNLDFLTKEEKKAIIDTPLNEGIGNSYTWKYFNKSNIPMHFFTSLRILFNKFQYSIKIAVNEEILLLKNYGDDITEFEIQEVANKWVRFALADLKKKIEEANKK